MLDRLLREVHAFFQVEICEFRIGIELFSIAVRGVDGGELKGTQVCGWRLAVCSFS